MSDIKDNIITIELSIKEDHYEFLSSISSAISYSENEYQIINEQIQETLETIKKLTPECDKIDYILSASCGALCSIFDIFFVGKPGDSIISDITDKWFEERIKDFAKLFGWKDSGKGLSPAISFLEKKFHVPYDQRGAGDAGRIIFDLNPVNHHFKSLAHNPTLLGLFFSIIDQFCTPNQSHFVSQGEIISLQNADKTFELKGHNIPSKLFCAFVNWFGHLISDLSGSSSSKGRGMGIPSPFFAWTNDIIVIKKKLNISVNEFDKSLNELALNIYKQGYDFRFQAAQAIPVIANELIVRFVYSVRRLIRYFKNIENDNYSFKKLWKECEPFTNSTVKRMLTVAHGTFVLIDSSDAVIRGFIYSVGFFNTVEFIMRLNIVGIGRLTILLYGEIDLITKKNKEIERLYFINRDKIIIEDYIEGLKFLSSIYNDKDLLTFIDDLKNSNMYKTAFTKSIKLARMRNVPANEILETKEDIDCYFNGGI